MASSPTISSILEEEDLDDPLTTLSPIPLLPLLTPSTPDMFSLLPRSATPSPPGGLDLMGPCHITGPPFLCLSPHSNPGTPQLSRPQSGRMSDRMKRFLRIPSTTNTGSTASVATSSVQATSPSIAGEGGGGGGAAAAAVVAMMGEGEQADGQGSNRDRLYKMFHQITNPRYRIRSFRRPRHIRRKRSVPERSHYSDDGYTSDPGILREEPKEDLHDHDEEEEEEDTESGDPDTELRKLQIVQVEAKLEKTKKLLQEGEEDLQETTNAFLQGMESTMSDKAQQRIRSRFLTKRPKAQLTITQLGKKVERYEQQIQLLKEGRAMEQHVTHHKWIKGRISGMKNGIKARVPRPPWKKKVPKGPVDPSAIPLDDDDDDEEVEETEDTIPEGDDETASYTGADPTHVLGSPQYQYCHQQQCDYCHHELQSIGDKLKRHEEKQAELHNQLTLLYNKLHDERDKTERLEGEFNTLTDLHQHEVIELRSQLAQMERVSFSKSQDLEDTLDSAQTRLHKLEVQVLRSIDIKESGTVPVGIGRRVYSPILTVLLEMLAVLFKMSNSMGKRTTLVLLLVLLILFVLFVRYLI